MKKLVMLAVMLAMVAVLAIPAMAADLDINGDNGIDDGIILIDTNNDHFSRFLLVGLVKSSGTNPRPVT